MSACTVRLLIVASEIVGGTLALANRLGIDELLLGKFMADVRPLPDALLLKAVHIILADRQTSMFTEQAAAQSTAKGLS